MNSNPKTIAETAEFLRSLGHSYIVPSSIRYLIQVGKLKAKKALNGRWLIENAEIDRFLKSKT
jgi:hypothetical protein